jgi:hypothetical protein
VATDILYNNISIFSGIAPVPFVERSLEPIRYGSKWGTTEVFSLNGQITGSCDAGLEEIINKSNIILSRVSPTSASLQIFDNGSLIVDKPYAKIKSFNLEEDITVGIKPFSMEFEAYEEDFFDGSYGVLDPINEISYEEGGEGDIIINRSCSARGFDTDSSALQNAIDYVQSLHLTIIPVQSILIQKNGSVLSPSLISIEEEINRLEGSYSLTKRYSCNANSPNSGFIFKISYDIQYSEIEGVYQVTASGSIIGNVFSDISDLRSAFGRLNLYALCRTAMFKYNGLEINPNPKSLNVGEEKTESALSFSVVFDTDLIASDIEYIYDTVISLDASADLCKVDFNGTIKSRKGQSARWGDIKNFYKTIDVVSICQTALSNEFIGQSRILALHPSSFESDFNERDGAISISASFNELHKKNKWSHIFRNFDYSLEFNRGLKVKHKIQTISNGSKVCDINSKTRSSCSVSGTGTLLNCSYSAEEISFQIKGVMQSILAENFISDYFVESISITEDLSKGLGVYGFSMSVSYYDSTTFLGD